MEFTTTNGGVEVTITPASFKAATQLKKVIMKGLADSDTTKSLPFDNLQEMSGTNLLDTVAKLLINIETAPEFEKAVMECLSVCIYDGKHKISMQLFDDIPEAREDYYEIVAKCCEVNLRPFFKSLITEFKTRLDSLKAENPQ